MKTAVQTCFFIGLLFATAACGTITSTHALEASSVKNPPAYFSEIKKEFGNDMNITDESNWSELTAVSETNVESKIKHSIDKQIAEALEVQAIKTSTKFAAVADEVFPRGDQHAKAVWAIAAKAKAKIYWFSADGEDGVFIVRGFVVVDPTSKTALMLYTQGEA